MTQTSLSKNHKEEKSINNFSLTNLSTGIFGASLIVLGMMVATPSKATTITGVTTFQTNGSDMAGMRITANFLGGSSETVDWVSLGGLAGRAQGNGWSLQQSGDTFDQPWTLRNSSAQSIVSLGINAIPGGTVFDILRNEIGTPDSSVGLAFSPISGFAPESFNYSDIVNVQGNPPVGDLFGMLTLNWNNQSPFTANSQVLIYQADTDSIAGGTGGIVEVPEPTSVFGFLAFGAFSASSFLRRKWLLKAEVVIHN